VSSLTSLPVHPTQLYESLVGGLLLLLLWWLRNRRRFSGQSFFAFTFGYGYLRFALELWRDDNERGSFGPALPAQLLVPALLLIFAAAFAYGPAQSITRLWLRRLAVAFGALLAVVAHFALRPAQQAETQVVSLSTSQWISLLTALAVAFAWHQKEAGTKALAAQPRPLSST
jgi:phosphatidylglycerol---prolipoprotein diacylglyceryl transferase